MKKILLFVGATALFASCSQEELLPSETVQETAKGIVFEANGGATTRGEMDKGDDKQYRFIWYAEKDRIKVYSSNVMALPPGNTAGNGVASFDFATFKPATYKATASGSYGLFTAKDDANWIGFKNDAKIRTIATYGNAELQSVVAVAGKQTVGTTKYDVTEKVNQITVKGKIVAGQGDNRFNYLNAPMLSNTEGSREKNYNSVGEKMSLDFYRIFPAICFSGVPGNDSFNKDLGELKTVTLTAKGGDAPAEGYDALAASNLTGEGLYTVKYTDAGEVHNTVVTGAGSTITVDVYSEWDSKDEVYMAILPVDRTIKKADNPDLQATEKLTITYEYDNITLTKNLETNSDWTEPHKIIPAPALDIEKDYPYIVTKTGRKLIVNKGNVKDAFVGNYIKWEDAGSTEQSIGGKTYKVIELSAINEIEVRNGANDLTSDDYAMLNKLTNVTKLVVKNATKTITYNALSALSKLEELQMDNVTTIQYTNEAAKNTPVNTTKLATVKLPKFNFADEKEITTAILKPSVLTTLDMSGTASMKKEFPYDGMSLSGYNALTTVTVQNGVVLGPESFMGCTALKTINGFVTLGGYGAFKGCTSLVNISIDMAASTKIWDETFKNASSLKNVYDKDGKAIVPAIIGNNAFESTKANIDLTATTSIGKSAFKNNSELRGAVFGAAGSTKYQLVVNATNVGESAFENATGLKYVMFTNLQTVNKSILAGTMMDELKFVNLFTFAEGAASKVFGNTTNTTLYVKPGQEYSANTISANGSKITFKTIIEEEE